MLRSFYRLKEKQFGIIYYFEVTYKNHLKEIIFLINKQIRSEGT